MHCCFCRAHPTPTRAPREGCGSPNPDPHQFITVLGIQLCPQLCLPVHLEMGTQEWDEGWWLRAPTQFSPLQSSAKRLLVTAQLLIKWGIDSSFLRIKKRTVFEHFRSLAIK